MRPKRTAIAANQDHAALSPTLVALASVPDTSSDPVVSSRVVEGASGAFLAYSSKSSRTRGQPA